MREPILGVRVCACQWVGGYPLKLWGDTSKTRGVKAKGGMILYLEAKWVSYRLCLAYPDANHHGMPRS